MAKSIVKPGLKTPQANFPVPPFISQAEVVNVLRLRSQFQVIKLELEKVQNSLLEKLGENAAVECGPHFCAEMNAHLAIWENGEFTGGQWHRQKESGVLA